MAIHSWGGQRYDVQPSGEPKLGPGGISTTLAGDLAKGPRFDTRTSGMHHRLVVSLWNGQHAPQAGLISRAVDESIAMPSAA